MKPDHEERLVKLLEDYATRADADYVTATKIFDARWTGQASLPELVLRVNRETGRLDALELNTVTVVEPCYLLLGDPDQDIFCTEPRPAGNTAAEPPKSAEFCLALLLSKAAGEAAIGDLSERFSLDCARFGVRRARRIYLGRALKSLWPLLLRTGARALRRGVMIESVRRFF